MICTATQVAMKAFGIRVKATQSGRDTARTDLD